jgi:hypothetical protein
MKPCLATFWIAGLASLATSAPAQETLADYKWSDLAPQALPHGAVVSSLDGRPALKIENTNDTPLQVSLLTIQSPKISAVVYGLMGEVRYTAVQGDGFLEMWNYYPPEKPGLPEGAYFSRTLGNSGPTGKISGTSDWRPFTLSFDRTGTTEKPVRLEINLQLPGRGTVYLGPLKLVQFPEAKPAVDRSAGGAWWSERTAGMAGMWGGVVIGVLGGLIGWLASKEKARAVVIAVLVGLTVVGGVLALSGVVALAQHQPYPVWYPLVIGAVLLLTVCPYNLRLLRKRWVQVELRRMASLDASGT